ncbi:MAG TPA: ABC transporter substrate-binding protein [Thermoanaerobaculia bacterium]|nr:ABC transporter substrate-binding protein [Thermoanaerobaculia bacterium]
MGEGAARRRPVAARAVLLAVLAVLAVVGAAACSPETPPAAPAPDAANGSDGFNRAGFRLLEGDAVEGGGEGAGWRRLEERSGRVVALSRPPRRIVSQSLASDEILLELIPDDRLLAVSALALDPRYSRAVEAAARVPRTVLHDTEELLSLRADLIVVASYTMPETLRQLDTAGAPVLRLRRFDGVEAIRANLRTLGFAVGEDETAAALIAAMDARIEAERRRVAAALRGRRPRVVSWDGGVAPGSGTTFDDVVRLLGAENASSAAGLDGWPRVGSEQILAWDPEAIFVAAPAGEEEAERRRLLADPRVALTAAGRAGRIHVVDAALFSTVSHHIGGLVEAIGGCLAPRDSPARATSGASR